MEKCWLVGVRFYPKPKGKVSSKSSSSVLAKPPWRALCMLDGKSNDHESAPLNEESTKNSSRLHRMLVRSLLRTKVDGGFQIYRMSYLEIVEVGYVRAP